MPRLFSARCLLFTTFCFALSSLALSSTIRDDVADSNYTSLSAQPQYAASGYVTVNAGGGSYVLGSGTLIAPNWILTAAHVVSGYSAGQITFGQGASRPGSFVGTYTAAQVVVYPGWSGDLSAGNDLALVKLSTNVTGVTPAPLYNATTLGTEVGQTATCVGYQAYTGTGLTGNNSALNLYRRAMTNVIDLIGSASTTSLGRNATNGLVNYNFGSMSSNIMLIDFDSPDNGTTVNNPNDPSNYYNVMGDGDPTAYEGSQVPGDSGGGLFLTVSGTTYIAGITSFVGDFGNTPFTTRTGYGYYGDYNGFTRVSPLADFIISTVPEPASLTVIAATCLVLCRRRRVA